uniref:DNA-directed RNA polymerase n=1 Tax=Neochloris aquatica TaxID=3099 RepID=A0A140H9I2_9CHLO|nr:RNA polymerase beta subunit [Neochloris aquatica]AMO00831.1 RNA polymerase beta subunit [Neochloris aquatica]
MPTHRNFLPDFVEIQRESFLNFLKKGILDEFSKRNPITNNTKTLEIFFYADYFCLTKPKYSIQQAIFFKKSYISKLYVPVQYTDKKKKLIFLKWILIADLPLMTKRGHFVLNGAARVIINQLVRSPGVYFRENFYEIYPNKWASKPSRVLQRFYADIICLKGTWVRIEIDKDFCMWVRLKKGPKIPLLWFLLGMGLNEKMIFQSVISPNFLLKNFLIFKQKNNTEILYKLELDFKNNFTDFRQSLSDNLLSNFFLENSIYSQKNSKGSNNLIKYPYISTTTEAWKEIAKLFNLKKNGSQTRNSLITRNRKKIKSSTKFFLKNFHFVTGSSSKKCNLNFYYNKYKNHIKIQDKNMKKFQETMTFSSLGRRWFFQKFMNPRTYDLGYKGRFALNKKLNLTISPNQTTLTAQDLLFITDYLMKVEKGIYPVDDIDHLKNKRIRSAGELIQMQFGIGLVRLEKTIRLKLNGKPRSSKINYFKNKIKNENFLGSNLKQKFFNSFITNQKKRALAQSQISRDLNILLTKQKFKISKKQTFLLLNSLIQPKFVNGALKEFFGTHPLSQFMDQINPLAELTHKRRLTSLGPGGVARDTATLAIRGIHSSHYGRICPIETPEGKNTGLVNSLTVYAHVNSQGFIESPFQSVYKGQIQKNRGKTYLSAYQEENFQIGTPDLNITEKNFLPKQKIPVRFGKNFSNYSTKKLSFIGISPLQMISVATALIPFLEHDDANRALMGSNMQRQAVPLIKPERPLVGTGLEAKVISDSGHGIATSNSGFVLYVSGSKIILCIN